MEPDFMLNQVQGLGRVLRANARIILDKRIIIENGFVHPDLITAQVETLCQVVADSVRLHAEFGAMNDFAILGHVFCTNPASNTQGVLQDLAQLNMSALGASVKLSTMSSTFSLGIVKLLGEIMTNNASLAHKHNVDVRKLNISKPQFTTGLVGWFYCVMLSYVSSATEQQETSRKAEIALTQWRADHEAMQEAQGNTEMKLAQLDAAFRALRETKRQVEAQAQLAGNAAKMRIENLMGELEIIHNAPASCYGKPHSRDAEIIELAEQYKKILKVQEEQRGIIEANARQLQQVESNRSQLSAQLVEAQQINATSSWSHTPAYNEMAAELVRLRNMLFQSAAEMRALEISKSDIILGLAAREEELARSKFQVATLSGMISDLRATVAVQQAELGRWKTQEKDDNILLENAARKIDELHALLREKDLQLSTVQMALMQSLNHGPTSAQPSSSSTSARKRRAPVNEYVDDENLVDDGWTVDLSAHRSALPVDRQEELNNCPAVQVNLGSPSALPEIFTRQSLSHILGGSIQGLVVRCTKSATHLAQQHYIQDYLCPNMDHNAWSPAGPGQHGYMQVGLGRDAKLFNDDGEERHVFVGTGRFFLYCGWYHVQRVTALTVEEWATLPDKVQITYSETTGSKNKMSMTGQQVKKMYDEGKLRAPCVRLQCLEFDTAFYLELVRANKEYFATKDQVPLSGTHSSKRRRIGTNISDTGSVDDNTLSNGSALARNETQVSRGPQLTIAGGTTSARQGTIDPALLAPTVSRRTSGIATRYQTRKASAQTPIVPRTSGGRIRESPEPSLKEDEFSSSSDSSDEDIYVD